MLRSFVYRLYPSSSQARLLSRALVTCRHFYNACLEERKTAWETEQKTVSCAEQLRNVKVYRKQNPEAANLHSHMLQVVVQDLDKAFRAFFRRVKSGQAPGYPRFKGAHRFHSLGLKEYGNGFRLDGRRLKVFGIGRLSVRWHRPLSGSIKTLRLVQKADGWYAVFVCELEQTVVLPSTAKQVGLDLGLSSLLTTSEGEKVSNPRHYRENQRKLKVLQRTVSRRQKGGANRRRAISRLRLHHQHVANSRKDYHHKVARFLVECYNVIYVEALNTKGLCRTRLSKSIHDAAWSFFVSILTSKAEEAGCEVIEVNPAYTSQTCSSCGSRFSGLRLSDRWVECSCGLSLDRDHNAAINVLNRGLGRGPWALSSSSFQGGLAQEAARL
jgi:putative transposase